MGDDTRHQSRDAQTPGQRLPNELLEQVVEHLAVDIVDDKRSVGDMPAWHPNMEYNSESIGQLYNPLLSLCKVNSAFAHFAQARLMRWVFFRTGFDSTDAHTISLFRTNTLAKWGGSVRTLCLDGFGFHGSDVFVKDRQLSDILRGCPNIDTLCLDLADQPQNGMPQTWAALLDRPRVTTLSLFAMRLDDDATANLLRAYPRLETLMIDLHIKGGVFGSSTSNISALTSLRHLETLHLHWESVIDEYREDSGLGPDDWNALSLKHLTLAAFMDDPAPASVDIIRGSASTLETLSISENDVKPFLEAIDESIELPKLRKLSFNLASLTWQRSLKLDELCPALEEVRTEGWDSDKILDKVERLVAEGRFPRLTRLGIEYPITGYTKGRATEMEAKYATEGRPLSIRKAWPPITLEHRGWIDDD